MSRVLEIRNMRLGEGMPKICVPVTGCDEEQIVREACEARMAGADLAEWRADCYDRGREPAAVCAVLSRLRRELGELPLLFTFRTAAEGGRMDLSDEEYGALIRSASASKAADLVDIELSKGEAACRALVKDVKAAGAAAVVSSHDFQNTPDEMTLLHRLKTMRSLGADVPKIAVMPRTAADVATLLEATARYREEADGPVITMSMSGLGSMSRVCGECFGSDLTFATVNQASAPGQMYIEDVRGILEILHRAITGTGRTGDRGGQRDA